MQRYEIMLNWDRDTLNSMEPVTEKLILSERYNPIIY